MSLLEIRNLSVEFTTSHGIVQANRNVSYSVEDGEILGVVGESGSGKSVSMLAVLGLLASNSRLTSGRILFNGTDISPLASEYVKHPELYKKQMKDIRGNKISMIFQDPMSFLNPLIKIGPQITEGILCHKNCTKAEAKSQAIGLMTKVGIPAAEERFYQYPFEFSGGMRQRIIIAIALSCNPQLIIADEPTTALDVTVQAQIMDLLREIAAERKTSVIIITHNLGVVAKLCDRINIMYAGSIVESGTTDQIFYDPKHWYTKGLLESVRTQSYTGRTPLSSIPGSPPDLLKLNSGCAFMPRCSHAMNICKDYKPAVHLFDDVHYASCWDYCRDQADEIVAGQRTLEECRVNG